MTGKTKTQSAWSVRLSISKLNFSLFDQLMAAYHSLWLLMTANDNIWQLMTAFDSLQHLLTAYDSLWYAYVCLKQFLHLMTAYDNFLQLMTVFDRLQYFWPLMTVYDSLNIFSHDSLWQFLTAFDSFRQHLKAFFTSYFTSSFIHFSLFSISL